MNKICPKCQLEVPKTQFHTNKRNKDGLCCYCKLCVRQYYYSNNTKNAKEIRRKCYLKQKENGTTYYHLHKEKQIAYQIAWRAANRARVNTTARKRMARIREAKLLAQTPVKPA